MTFHKFEKESVVIDFVERLRQIYGAKVGRASTSDVTVNNIADCPDGKTTTNTVFESKFVVGSAKVITEPIKNTIFEQFRQNRANGDVPEIVTQ